MILTRSRLSAALAFVAGLGSATLLSPRSLEAQGQAGPPPGDRVRTVTDTLVGAVGGLAVDGLGAIYVADFGETVHKVLPDGRWTVFATGLYGSSGNAIDSRGRLLQSQFTGNSIARVSRAGEVEPQRDHPDP